MTAAHVQSLFVKVTRKYNHRKPSNPCVYAAYDKPMHKKPELPKVFSDRLLNLNENDTSITYSKSHSGPRVQYWQQVDAEEIERLFTSGKLRSIYYHAIPPGKDATYVNPICSEKLRDTGAIKFRTRATIGGDNRLPV
jgi:hypothetical protein